MKSERKNSRFSRSRFSKKTYNLVWLYHPTFKVFRFVYPSCKKCSFYSLSSISCIEIMRTWKETDTYKLITLATTTSYVWRWLDIISYKVFSSFFSPALPWALERSILSSCEGSFSMTPEKENVFLWNEVEGYRKAESPQTVTYDIHPGLDWICLYKWCRATNLGSFSLSRWSLDQSPAWKWPLTEICDKYNPEFDSKVLSITTSKLPDDIFGD